MMPSLNESATRLHGYLHAGLADVINVAAARFVQMNLEAKRRAAISRHVVEHAPCSTRDLWTWLRSMVRNWR